MQALAARVENRRLRHLRAEPAGRGAGAERRSGAGRRPLRRRASRRRAPSPVDRRPDPADAGRPQCAERPGRHRRGPRAGRRAPRRSARGWPRFGGVKRRFTTTGVAKGIRVIDDYGHHPVEIAAVLKAARDVQASSGGKVVAVVQPHRYSRLHDLFAEFCGCFNDADTVIVADVYRGRRERRWPGVDREQPGRAGMRRSGHRRVLANSKTPPPWPPWSPRRPRPATSWCCSAPATSPAGRRRPAGPAGGAARTAGERAPHARLPRRRRPATPAPESRFVASRPSGANDRMCQARRRRPAALGAAAARAAHLTGEPARFESSAQRHAERGFGARVRHAVKLRPRASEFVHTALGRLDRPEATHDQVRPRRASSGPPGLKPSTGCRPPGDEGARASTDDLSYSPGGGPPATWRDRLPAVRGRIALRRGPGAFHPAARRRAGRRPCSCRPTRPTCAQFLAALDPEVPVTHARRRLQHPGPRRRGGGGGGAAGRPFASIEARAESSDLRRRRGAGRPGRQGGGRGRDRRAGILHRRAGHHRRGPA